MKNILFIFPFAFGSLFAQEQVVIVRNEKNSRPVRKETSDRIVENRDAFKFDPLRMFVGELNFAWEHSLGERTSMEIELGPTISHLRLLGNNDFHIGGFNNTNSYSVSQMGVLVSAGIRFYPLEDYKVFNRMYVSPKLHFRNYNIGYNSPDIPNDARGVNNQFSFLFNIGTQRWYSDNFALDFYAGLGIGSVNSSSYLQSFLYDGNTGLYTSEWKKYNETYARILLNFGMKVAIGN